MGGGPKVKPNAQGQKGNQSKRSAEEGTGMSPEFKKVNSPAPTRRERSQDVSKGGAGQARLAQSTMDSFVSPAGAAVDKGKGGPGGNESTPPNGSHVDMAAAFPSLPGAPPPPISGIHFPEPPTCASPAVSEFYNLMCSVGTKLKNAEINISDLANMQVYMCAAFGSLMMDVYKQTATFAEVVKTQKGMERELNSVQTNQTTEQARQVFEDDNSHSQLSLYLPRGQQVVPGLLDDLQDEKGRPAGVALLEDLWKFIDEKASLVNLGPFHKGMVTRCWVKKKQARGDQPAAAMVTVECSTKKDKQRVMQLLRRKVDLSKVAQGKAVPQLRKLPPTLHCSTAVLDSRLRHRKMNVGANQAYNVITSAAHSLKQQGAVSGFDLSYVWARNQPALSLATRGASDSRHSNRIVFDPVSVLQDFDKGKQYISDTVKSKIPHADMRGVFTDDFERKLKGTQESYKAILDTFSAARVRKKLRSREKGGKQSGEGRDTQTAEGNIGQVQGGEEGITPANAQAPPPVLAVKQP